MTHNNARPSTQDTASTLAANFRPHFGCDGGIVAPVRTTDEVDQKG